MEQMKLVLDPACGGRMFYFDKNDPRVEFCDIRQEQHVLCDGRVFNVNPDTVCDFTNLPHQDSTFNLVIFDPPHLKHAGTDSWLARKYGRLPKDYEPMLAKGFEECFRVLKPGGTLIFKWNETQIKIAEILKLTTEKPLLRQKVGQNVSTHWIVFFKQERNTHDH